MRRHTLEEKSKLTGAKPWWSCATEDLYYQIQFEPTKNPTNFRLEWLRPFFGARANKAAESLVSLFAIGAPLTALGMYQCIRTYVKAFNSANTSGPITATLESKTALEEHMSQWSNEVKVLHAQNPGTAKAKINGVNRCFRRWGTTGIIPPVEVLTTPRHASKRRRNKPSIPEQIGAKVSVSDDVQAAVAGMISALHESDQPEAKNHLYALAAILESEGLPKSPDGIIEALKVLEQTCIETIHRMASTVFRDWQRKRSYGIALLEHADGFLAEQIALAMSGGTDAARLVQRLANTYTNEQLLAATLKCYVERFKGRPVTQASTKNFAFFTWLMSRIGGRPLLDALLGPSVEAVAAAILITLCETGANVATVLELESDLGLRPLAEHPGYFLFSALKRRAGNTIIIDILPETSKNGLCTAVEALRSLQVEGELLRNSIGTQRLFVHRYDTEPSIATDSFVRRRLANFLKAAFTNPIYLTPSAIRPSVLTLNGLKKDADSLIVKIIAGHSETSQATSAYQFRLASRLRVHAYARQYHDLMHEAAADSRAAEKPEAVSEHSVFDSVFSMVVEISEEVLIDARLTCLCLERSFEELFQTRREHWTSLCEKALAWSEVVLEKAAKSPLAHRLKHVDREAERRLGEGYVHFLE